MAEEEKREETAGPATKRPVILRIVRYTLYYVMAAIVIYYFIMAALSPVIYIRDLNSRYSADTTLLKRLDERFLQDSAYIALSQKMAFTGARMRMSSSDSIGLTVNLTDSLITLEIKGVTLRSIPVISYSVAGTVSGIDRYALSALLAEPMHVESSEASIAKEPLMVKIAPRDTAEASALPLIVPDTLMATPVFFRLRLTHGIRLVVLEEVNGKGPEKLARNRFLFKQSVRDASDGFARAMAFKFPVYEPEIRLIVSRVDARIIYRALPYNGMVVLGIR
jgi:hypothetical protein